MLLKYRRNMKKKIFTALSIIIFLTTLGLIVYYFKSYYDSDIGKTKIYKKELKNKINLQGNKTIIKIVKEDINKDGTEDYVVLLGEEKYEDNDTTKSTDMKKLLSNVEMYNNICIDYIDGNTKETKRYDTKKSFGTDVNIQVKKDKENSYILVSDTSTGNIALLYLKENEVKNIIADSFSSDFSGYTIEAEFKKEDETKLVVSLDNFGRDYLTKKEEKIELDYKDTNVNKDNYRLTYMANKFCEFEVNQDEEQNLELVGIQNILYSNKGELEKTSGKVKTKFKLNEDKKLVIKDVEVIK